MAHEKNSRRGAILSTSALLLSPVFSQSLLGAGGAGGQSDPEVVFIPPGGGLEGKISASDIVFKFD